MIPLVAACHAIVEITQTDEWRTMKMREFVDRCVEISGGRVSPYDMSFYYDRLMDWQARRP